MPKDIICSYLISWGLSSESFILAMIKDMESYLCDENQKFHCIGSFFYTL
ncbi:hypothetical protein KPL31_06220 [Clostridium algidicarnis]|nr:hypothetical protein [Clostridium algidicarnis]MBU3228657.1 hypothetical protein [Clostridium algidicarnis]MBU3251297.1 hypothetical protein [Clostridium algidicarnis]